MILYFLTGNKHKFREVSDIVSKEAPWIVLKPLSGIEKIEIQSDSLENIVLYAAEAVAKTFRENFIIEDAGLFIHALRGFPGPYSHYVYKTIGIEGILKLMEGIKNRHAEFRSTIALHYNGIIKIFTGIVPGRISESARGTFGFGFDPIFIPEGESRTFAEMRMEEKNKFSHRARAMRKVISFLESLKEEKEI